MPAVLALLALLCSPAWAQNNSGGAVVGTQAVVPLVDPVNMTIPNQISACTGPADSPFPADNSYLVTLTSPKRLVVGQIDGFCLGDYYQASVNGVVFNTTPNPCTDASCTAANCWGCVSGTCAIPLSAGRTSACVPAGDYAITVTDPGFIGRTAAEITAELMCPAGFQDFLSSGDATNCDCRELQLGVILVVPDESTFENHGKYVSAATHALQNLAAASTVSPECQSCIINQFARSVPQDQMASCAGL
jgi:hypothetical protein